MSHGLGAVAGHIAVVTIGDELLPFQVELHPIPYPFEGPGEHSSDFLVDSWSMACWLAGLSSKSEARLLGAQTNVATSIDVE